jgi:hypothetical protein
VSVSSASSFAQMTYAISAWVIMLLGALHTAATFRLFHSMTESAIWFASAGVLLMLIAMLNLLSRRYGRAAAGLRRTTIVANIAGTVLSALGGAAGPATPVQIAVVVGIWIVLTLHSVVPSALKR